MHQAVTCKKDVGRARFGLVPSADVAIAELGPAAEFPGVSRRGVDQGQLAVALMLLHAMSTREGRSEQDGHLLLITLSSTVLRCQHPTDLGQRLLPCRWHKASRVCFGGGRQKSLS